MAYHVAQRPQSARPHVPTRPLPKAASGHMTLATFRFAPDSDELERTPELINVQSNVHTLLSLMADDSNMGLHQPTRVLQASRFRTHLPSTVLVGPHCDLYAWYMTSKDGHVVRKHKSNCNWKSVLQAFCGHMNKGFSPLSHRGARTACRDHWPVAVAKFVDGRTRLLSGAALIALVKGLEASAPGDTDFATLPFCLTQFVPPAKRVRYLSVYTVVEGAGDCHVVVAELPPFYREQVHSDLPVTDGNINTDPIQVVQHGASPRRLLFPAACNEVESSMLLGEAIQKETTLLARHINRHNAATGTPVVHQLILEYMVHAKDGEVYLTSILGVSWQNGEQVHLVDAVTNNVELLDPSGPAPPTAAVARQIFKFSRSLKGSQARCEVAERQVLHYMSEAEKAKAQVSVLHDHLQRTSDQLQVACEATPYKMRIEALETALRKANQRVETLEEQLQGERQTRVESATLLTNERNTFCVALQQAQAKIETLTKDLELATSTEASASRSLSAETTAHARTQQLLAGLEALLAQQKDIHATHVAKIRTLEDDLTKTTEDRDHLQRLVPYANIKKTAYCKRLHLHDLYLGWPDWQLQVECLDRVVSMHVLTLQKTFDHFQPMKLPVLLESTSITRTYPLIHHRLNFAQLCECMRLCGVLTTRFTTAVLETVFLKCTEKSFAKQTKGPTTAGVGRPRGMSFMEFIECVVRVAMLKCKASHMAAEAVQSFMDTHLLPAEQKW
ncbi:hypothetical protein SPRG_13538 [Saprolegnia parasitica CBS 223.65]|uniref:Uncharacterized protein n=1 Tax=Saprolegnia parasitica (strain CBS 223.65) TaxID=695850 RepID=A0A067C2L7_SAPPC|nr:hypothetical protein SPRG_13538 [Saprolegnia parasitica CBS 223.65]KDO20786.1 hypothetical protein SPRG_13538 [Saprolegnia parasitica CBS 223.65]|eukprot:XP_012208524.1 hypothetical protein SPRG_13538 [Saprolegnia parasitica CBS 223.65]